MYVFYSRGRRGGGGGQNCFPRWPKQKRKTWNTEPVAKKKQNAPDV